MLYFSQLIDHRDFGLEEVDTRSVFERHPWNGEARHVRQIVDDPPERPAVELSKLKINREDHDSDRGPRWTPIITATVLVLLAGAATIGYRYWTTSVGLPEVEVAHASVESGDTATEVLTATGYVVAHRKAAVSPKISGRLEYMGVDTASFVKENQVLARLEHHDLDAQLEDTRAVLAQAQAAEAQAIAAQAQAAASLVQAQASEHQTHLDFDRQTQLVDKGVVSRSDFDNADAKEKVALAQVKEAQAQQKTTEAQLNTARSQIRSAQARIRGIETQIEYTNIRSPFDGLVISKDAEVGESVAPAIFGGGATRGSVVTIVDPKTLEVEADVNESNITRILSGQPAQITLDAIPDKKFEAEAYQVVPTADRQKATVKVKVRFLNLDPRILPDMTAKVTFLKKNDDKASSQKSRIMVPKSAIQQRESKTVVLILTQEKVRVQPIRTGSDFGDRIEVLDGLVGGETVLVRGGDGLKDGARVKVKAA
jgi:RND family efflux transporter MFP subunit